MCSAMLHLAYEPVCTTLVKYGMAKCQKCSLGCSSSILKTHFFAVVCYCDTVFRPKTCCFQDAIDWRRLRVLWSPSKGPHPPCRPPSMSPGPVASSPDSGGRQSHSARRAVAGNPAGAVATSPSYQAQQVKHEQPLHLLEVSVKHFSRHRAE